ncbi:hypothetical protein [Xylophilus ampelinus]|uniref:Lipoprotein n=1 Tax=Xylophilus ampelinus TaxID=54067 RepID=A0A318SKI1_9BURK|nr:hypothetical protein [Xylophilus ampelinus]MCS4508876.1 hypothetical protein [Xylophilus ampelinus]PYE79445.1 hypothetical protein DFQ15_102178 [Xylophilus ampelinus]
MKVAIVIAAAGALAGCGTARTVQVKVPVPVECRVQTPARPAMPLDALRPPYDVDTWVAHAIAEVDLRQAYEQELVVALSSCISPIAPVTE